MEAIKMCRIGLIINFFFTLSLFNLAFAEPYNLELAWTLEGFDKPESVLHDPALDILYVSNISGGPLDKNHKGYISIVSVNGNMLNEKWVIGLNAPKGMGIKDRTLYVADIDELVAIDVDRGRIINRYYVDDAKLFNDITVADNGDVFLSDMLLNRIHKLTGNNFETWLESDVLQNPNGLHFTEDDIIVGSWGVMTDGFKTDVPGHLLRISITTKNISSIGAGTPIGNLDGVEGNDELGFYATDWLNGGLFYIDLAGEGTKLLDFEQGSADFELLLEKKMLVIPHMIEGKLYAYELQ